MGKFSRRGFAKGVLGGLVGIVGAVTTRGYEPLAGEIKPTTHLPANAGMIGQPTHYKYIDSGIIPTMQCSYNIMLHGNNPMLFHDEGDLVLYCKSKKEEDCPQVQLLTFLDGLKYIPDIKDKDKVWTLADKWVSLKDCTF